MLAMTPPRFYTWGTTLDVEPPPPTFMIGILTGGTDTLLGWQRLFAICYVYCDIAVSQSTVWLPVALLLFRLIS